MAANDTESTPLSTSEAGLDLSCARTDDARWRSLEERQALLQRLVVGALCGLMLQACCIYRLIGFAVSSNAAVSISAFNLIQLFCQPPPPIHSGDYYQSLFNHH